MRIVVLRQVWMCKNLVHSCPALPRTCLYICTLLYWKEKKHVKHMRLLFHRLCRAASDFLFIWVYGIGLHNRVESE